MTDQYQILGKILEETECILLDFDGPVCSVFAEISDQFVATRLRTLLLAAGVKIPGQISDSRDPFKVLCFVDAQFPDLSPLIEAALRVEEVSAVEKAMPTVGSTDAIRAIHKSGRQAAIVSNNSMAAVEVYLNRYRLQREIDFISARTSKFVGRLKPHPEFADRAIDALRVSPSKAVLIGDSVTDIQAGRAAGVSTIGFANKPGKEATMAAEGADVIITSMRQLCYGLRSANG
jgi:HAD superfamily hydrolase (TIGR01509 family)